MYRSRCAFSGPRLLHRASVGKRANPVSRILEYLMVPTEGKLVADSLPYFSGGFYLPQEVLARAAKARQPLREMPATAVEVLLKKLTS